MGVPVELAHACGRCGEQVVLSIETDSGTYSHDLAALLQASRDDTLLIEAECGCQRPRRVAVQGAARPPSAPPREPRHRQR